MKLKKDEFVRQVGSRGIGIAKLKSKKRSEVVRYVPSIEGVDAMEYLYSHAYTYIDKEIVGYFDLKAGKYVYDCILHGEKPTGDFSFGYQIDKETREMNIKITLHKTLTPQSRDYLLERIDDVNLLIQEFYRTENTKGLGTLRTRHQRVKGVSNFDEKFELSKAYKSLKIKYPTRIPKKELETLLGKAKTILKKNAYTPDDFRKDIFDFDKYLEAS